MDKIWEQVKENRRKLDSCKQHDFERRESGVYYYCKHCGGRVDISGAYWYKRGLEHGKEGINEDLSC